MNVSKRDFETRCISLCMHPRGALFSYGKARMGSVTRGSCIDKTCDGYAMWMNITMRERQLWKRSTDVDGEFAVAER